VNQKVIGKELTMQRKTSRIMHVTLLSVVAVIAICPEVFGLDGGNADYGGKILAEEGNKLKSLVKPALGIGGIAGLVMGGIQAFKQSAIGPLLTWFGIGAGGLAGYGLLGSSMFSALIP
jgi:hypothetical protein